ncbi:zinc finger, CCHC-type containing protein [Tanacetum coccineum]
MDAVMKHMASNFAKLEKFEGVYFRRWQKKMNFLLSSMSVVYLLTTPMPEDGGLILNGMFDSLFDIYHNVETSKELWDTLEAKYMAEDASSNKFFVGNFTNYKMTWSRPVLEHTKKNWGNFLINTPSWKDFKHTLKHLKDELTLVELGSHLRIEESLKAQDNDKLKGNNVAGPSVVNMVEHNNSTRYNDNKANGSGTKGLVDGSSNSLKGADSRFLGWKLRGMLTTCYLLNRVLNKRNMIAPYELWTKKKPNLDYLRVWSCRAVVRLPDPKLKTLDERGIECIFVGYAEHSKAFRFFVIEPNESVAINSIIKSKDAIFDENRFLSIPRPTMESQDVAFWKEVINDEMDSIMGNNTWVLADLPPSYKPLGCKWIFIRKLKVDGTVEKFKARLVDLKKEFLSSRFSMKDIGEADVILVSTPTNTCEKLMTNNGQAVSQLEYSRVIGCLMYAMTCTRPGIAFVVGKLSRYTSNPGTQHLQAIQRASKKQTCITGSTMEYEFVALATACKEAE